MSFFTNTIVSIGGNINSTPKTSASEVLLSGGVLGGVPEPYLHLD